jgi:hypothetical protein
MSNVQDLSQQLCDADKFVIRFHLIEYDSNNFEFISTCVCFKIFTINVVSGVIAFRQVTYAHFDVNLIYLAPVFVSVLAPYFRISPVTIHRLLSW